MMLNIVIPMAGRGSRFATAGYTLPKPLIRVHDRKPLIELVIENLRPARPHRFIFLCLREHLDAHGLEASLREWAPGCEIVVVDRVTEGAACTVLLARHLIESADPLMIANSDQWLDFDIDAYLGKMDEGGFDGYIMTMWADDPKWSFVRFDDRGEPAEVVEKRVVSNEATTGIYNFREGRFFTQAADRMIARGERVNGEFYVAPAYNGMIAEGLRLGVCNIGREHHGFHGLGVPEDLRTFETLPVSRRAVKLRDAEIG